MHECPGFLSIKHSSTHPKGFLCVTGYVISCILYFQYIYWFYKSIGKFYNKTMGYHRMSSFVLIKKDELTLMVGMSPIGS